MKIIYLTFLLLSLTSHAQNDAMLFKKTLISNLELQVKGYYAPVSVSLTNLKTMEETTEPRIGVRIKASILTPSGSQADIELSYETAPSKELALADFRVLGVWTSDHHTLLVALDGIKARVVVFTHAGAQVTSKIVNLGIGLLYSFIPSPKIEEIPGEPDLIKVTFIDEEDKVLLIKKIKLSTGEVVP